MITPSRRSAHATRACRRSGDRTAPVGYWWAAVTTTRSTLAASSRSTRNPGVVDRDLDDVESERPEVCPGLRLGGVLDGGATGSPGAKHARDQLEALREPGADDDRLRVRRRPANAIEVLGEGGPELWHAAAVEITEPGARRFVERSADGAQPRIARELVQVRAAWPEVELVDGRHHGRPPRPGDARMRGHLRQATGPGRQVPLGRELLERLDDDPARDAELGGHRTGRRKGRPGPEPAASDHVAQTLLELPMERLGAVPVQRDEHLRCRTGPTSWH